MVVIGKDSQGRTTFTFDYTGAVQSYEFPEGEYLIETWGAQGVDVNIGGEGGKGGYAKGKYTLSSKAILFVMVGGSGKNGGFNGGASAYSSNRGGGASDVRLIQNDLNSRFIVAGGGGGGARRAVVNGEAAGVIRKGGDGGGLVGENGDGSSSVLGGASGTQSSGGIRNTGNARFGSSGSFGHGGSGGTGSSSSGSVYVGGHGGGGGGGWYGGAGGDGASISYEVSTASSGGGGGGGSSYIDGVKEGSTTAGLKSGDGLVVFTALNATPIVTVTSPTANQTLYENDTLNIAGTADDADIGDVVTVRYQINAQPPVAILPFVADGSPKSFSHQLTFKDGNLYDGNTLISSNLADGVPHTLKVYANDDKGGQSAIIERIFFVVPNRAPVLNVNPPTTDGNTDADKITINGDFNEPDGNQAVVKYRINGGNSVQIAEGTSGTFEFDVSFAQLQVGVNNIVVEVIDSHNAKTSRTIKFNKAAIETQILKSTARYKILPPTGSASAVLLWVTRDAELQIDAAISMTQQGEVENFVPVAASNSAPSPDFPNAIEDEFYLEADSSKDNIVLQLDMTRPSLDVNPKVYIIQGVLE